MAYKFRAHFNRVNMQRGSPKVWTVHFRGKCIQAEGIRFDIGGSIQTVYEPMGRQPRATLRGYAEKVKIEKGVAVVT